MSDLPAAVSHILLAAIGLVLSTALCGAENPPLPVETISLPELRIDRQETRAHTQGLEIVGHDWFVTARRDDLLPKQAFLLRTRPGASRWETWDITPRDAAGNLTALDHPGGMQSDGQRLWIPVAESRRYGRSLIRVFRITAIRPEVALEPELEFEVRDHIGALAVSVQPKQVFGASWDTEKVYVWDWNGRLLRVLEGEELSGRHLGVRPEPRPARGLAVQDWKIIDGQWFAAGLFRTPGAATTAPMSRLFCGRNLLAGPVDAQFVALPLQHGTEMAREGMAVHEGNIFFLPEDLGSRNRAYRLPLNEVVSQPARKR